MSENREPTYLELDWSEDFKLDAHVDSDGQQRFAVSGYIYKRKSDGVYRAPLLPELFFGENGQQLQTWSQYLTAGDHTILRRDSGNPTVPESELAWSKVSSVPVPQQTPAVAQPAPTHVAPMAIPYAPILALVGIPIGFYLLYKLLGKATK